MWYTDWLGDLCFGDESICDFRLGNSRTMRTEREKNPKLSSQHISNKREHRFKSMSAKDR